MSQIVNALGMTAGTLGLCIAVYMQMLCSRKIDPQYVILFWLLGIVLITANMTTLWVYTDGVVVFQVMIYLLVTILQLWLAKKIISHSEPINEELLPHGA